MFSIQKPKVNLKEKKKNAIALSLDDYGGGPSTLCGGCGHDSVTAAIITACFELSIPPEQVAKMSGIGCSSKTPGYFLKTAHAFNAVHGRMPSVTTGAYAANRNMHFLAVSGDGDTGSIGLGQFMHALRRRLNMLYIIENNGVYGLTKGQFSALADTGSISRKGDENLLPAMDPVRLALEAGASFVARSFSGDKQQLIPLIKAGLSHKGFALIDVLSPCVSFNNHQGSTRSYDYIRAHEEEATHIEDFIPHREEIVCSEQANRDQLQKISMHDGSILLLRNTPESQEVSSKRSALQFIEQCVDRKEIATGLLYCDPDPTEYHELANSASTPLRDLPMKTLIPGPGVLEEINQTFR